jgi:outer membrane protein assembly factor BamB
MNVRLLAVAVVTVAMSLPLLRADDWPQWRGPERTGLSKETGLLKEWPKDGPKLLWQLKEIDYGFSTPSVVGDRLYLLSNKGLDDEFIQALAVKDGKQVWSTKLGNVGPNEKMPYPAARSTPTVDGDRIFALGSDGDLVCMKTADGAEVWRKSLRKDLEGKPGSWAYAESPLIDGDVLVCTPGGKTATLAALNKKTGETLWKSAVPEGDEPGYASAIAVDAGGVKQYVQLLQKGLVGVDAKSGKFLWRFDKIAGGPANIPTPVAHDGYIYGATAYGGGGLVKLKAEKDEVTAEQVYAEKTLPNCIGGSVRVGDFLYGCTAKELLCVEFATGSIRWHDKGVGPGSVFFADGCLYVHGENGDVLLVEATPDGYREKGRFTPPDQPKRGITKAWAYPVVANGRLYIRDLGVLWCYDVKAEKDKK